MTDARLPLGAFATGILLVALSFAWLRFFGGQAVWTDDDARSHAAAAIDLHRASEDGGAAPEILATAERRADESQARLDAAENRGRTVAWLLRWSGIAASLAGAIGFFVLRK